MSVIRIDPSNFRPASPRVDEAIRSNVDAAERNRVMQAHAKAMSDLRRFRILKLVTFR